MKPTLHVVLTLMAAPFVAFAQQTVEVIPEPSFADKFLTPGGIALILGIVGTILGSFLAGKAVMKRRIAKGVLRAYQVVNDIAEEDTRANGIDKAAVGLAELNKWMLANGWRQLTKEEEALARLEFQALHGAEKQAVAVMAEALTQAKTGATVVPFP